MTIVIAIVINGVLMDMPSCYIAVVLHSQRRVSVGIHYVPIVSCHNHYKRIAAGFATVNFAIVAPINYHDYNCYGADREFRNWYEFRYILTRLNARACPARRPCASTRTNRREIIIINPLPARPRLLPKAIKISI